MSDLHAGHEDNHARHEAIGAFAHEVRTPLTSMRMVLEIARRNASGDELRLDGELAQMLTGAVDQLQRLADDLQDLSRLERGKLSFGRGPSNLADAIEAAAPLSAGIVIKHGPAPVIEGPWERGRMARAIAGFAEAVNRLGDGSGVVRVDCETGDGVAFVRLSSGRGGNQEAAAGADAGFAFFHSRLFVLALCGSVELLRAAGGGGATIKVTLRDTTQGEVR